MNKVTTDFAMGIADKDLSEELQVQSEQPWEVECKCLASHPSAGGPGADRSPQDLQELTQTDGRPGQGDNWDRVVQNRGTSPAEPGWPWAQTALWVQSRGQKKEEGAGKNFLSPFPGRVDVVWRSMMLN